MYIFSEILIKNIYFLFTRLSDLVNILFPFSPQEIIVPKVMYTVNSCSMPGSHLNLFKVVISRLVRWLSR